MLEGKAPFYELYCDFCSNDETIEADSFQEAVDQKKELGWISVKDGGEWKDKCSSCQEDKEETFDFGNL